MKSPGWAAPLPRGTHSEREEVRQSLLADFGQKKREGMEFCNVFQDNITMFVEADIIILNITTAKHHTCQ